MASELYVETLKGLTSGANANKVIIPSGQTLDASAGGFTTPAGHVIQVVSTSYNTAQAISSTSWTAITGVTATITPTSTASKILVAVNLNAETYQNGNGSVKWYARLKRGSSIIMNKIHDSYAGTAANGYYSFSVHGTLIKLDSPSTTGATTYSLEAALSGTPNSATFRLQDNSEGVSTITLMEIAG